MHIRVNDRSIDLEAVVVAGYTGRDRDAVMHHIAELEEIGVPPPASVPMYWRLPPWVATQDPSVVVVGRRSSGEAELVLVVDGDDTFVTVGSDHTDREAEAVDIGMSKAVCPKPVAAQAWPIADIGDRWGELVLRSWIDELGDGNEVVYQDGACSSLVSPVELLAGVPFKRPQRFMLLTGTMPVIGGIRPAARFRAELIDERLDRRLTLTYRTRSLEDDYPSPTEAT